MADDAKVYAYVEDDDAEGGGQPVLKSHQRMVGYSNKSRFLYLGLIAAIGVILGLFILLRQFLQEPDSFKTNSTSTAQ
uniref:Syndecan n=1 Tax=Panagrellus redivivus TaxID=6233 RepID=A0A7E4V3C5_PANRE